MKQIYLIVILLFLSSCKEKIDSSSFIQDGVPASLAEYRNQQVSDVRYSLSFTIPEQKERPVLSKLVLDLTILNLDAPLILDFKEDSEHLKSLKVNGNSEDIVHKNEHLVISRNSLSIGTNQIEIEFIMGELSLNRNDEYLYTLLVPDRARTLFPCFDQPNIKAKYKLSITVPTDWQVLCGAPETQTLNKGSKSTHNFSETKKIPTYLFSFVAGKFEKASNSADGFDMNLLYRENDSSKIALSIPAIFDLHHQSVQFLEEYTAYDFPFQKLDYATIPAFQYGGMEHVGAIQYRESSLFLDNSATENRRLRRAKLIAHETAHMWFGDLVTMNWFDDVWMKEVFANFMADKIVNPAFPDINHKLSFMVAHYPSAYSEDRTLGTNPIRQPLNNLNNAGSLYGRIIYNKAPIMMRQLETVMGQEPFQKGIQNYIEKYAYSNAVWNDLVELLDEQTNQDLKTWSEIWVNQSSRPIFKEEIEYSEINTIKSFLIYQTAEDSSDRVWPQTFEIAFKYADTIRILKADIKTRATLIPEAKGLPKPEAILYNSNGLGYGVFPFDDSSLDYIPQIKDPVARGYAYINLYENVLEGSYVPLDAFQRYKVSLASEENELLLNLVSGYLDALFWKYLTPEQRQQNQPALEKQLLGQLKSNLPPHIKKTLFTRFRSIAFSDSGRNVLYKVWNKSMKIPNLKLNQDDYTSIALDLSLFSHKDKKEILEKTKIDIKNPDKLKRFEFLLPAVSENSLVRDDFFESLKEEKNRAKENWTLSAINYLNHPLQQKESIKYLTQSLELLDEIQKTGDIFFPKGWLNNTIGNYSSPEAYAILEKYIEVNPNLNPALMKKLLQASDDLRRVQLLNKNIYRNNN
ncbi:MAG: M1 family metallopeptidase [Maribacter sp.]